MSRVFITGSADGLGKLAAQLLVEQGHHVVLHARNAKRAKDALAAVPGAETVVIGDLSSISETRSVAEQVNRLGSFDSVIHNAAVGYREKKRIKTQDGLPYVFVLEPGWVPTKMGGPEAPDDLEEGYRTQVWLAVSDEPAAKVAGEYFYHRKRVSPSPATRVVATQERLLSECQKISGIHLVR